MYRDEQNLYHYVYRRDGTETDSQDYYQPSQPPIQEISNALEMKPVKKKRSGTKLKIAAFALCCALLGGAAGAGILWGVGNMGTSESINISGRNASSVALKTVDGKTAMSDAEVYAASVNSVVSINTTGTAGYNVFHQQVPTASAGSGFILTQDGYIVTNHHVISDADTVKVTLYNDTTYDATVIGSDKDNDIAVLKIQASEDLQPVTIGDSSKLNVGDRVLAIGNPLGELTFSMSGGMVSSVNRAINVEGTPFNMIQTDASINPGNSGGPLFNSYGEVIGIVSAKYSSISNESVEGLGFAIPINDVLHMLQDIMTNGRVTNKAYLGINAEDFTAQLAAKYNYTGIEKGVFVDSVTANSAAEKAGFQMGDVITKIDDKTINSMNDLSAFKKQISAGDTSTVTVYRQGSTQTLTVTWDTTPVETETSNDSQQEQQYPQYSQDGNTYMDPSDLFRYFFGSQFN